MVLAAVSAASAVTIYDSQGFENPPFVTGALNGQDGWAGAAAGGGVEPTVVTAPDPVLGQQAVRLAVGDTQGDASGMDISFGGNLLAMGYNYLTVSYDIYRQPGPRHNMWWWLWDAGEPTYGLQWDLDGTLPHGWNPGAGSTPTVVGAYANVTMVWDMVQAKAYSWYNGILVDNGIPITNVTSLTGWHIGLGHEGPSGNGADVAWIDNFLVTALPEPATLALVALGMVCLLRRRR